jgi:hypothetical protein
MATTVPDEIDVWILRECSFGRTEGLYEATRKIFAQAGYLTSKYQVTWAGVEQIKRFHTTWGTNCVLPLQQPVLR